MSGSLLNPNFESGSGQDLKNELPEPRLVFVDGNVGVVDDLVGVLVQKRGQDARGTYKILKKQTKSVQNSDVKIGSWHILIVLYCFVLYHYLINSPLSASTNAL